MVPTSLRYFFYRGKMAAATLEYGNGLWWNSALMLAHLREVMEIRKSAFPWA